MSKIDRYVLLCVSISVVILVITFFSPEDENEETIGIVYEVKETQNGYTFFFADDNGDKRKCFNRVEPIEYEIYSIKGTFSDDRSMFFVSSMDILFEHEPE